MSDIRRHKEVDMEKVYKYDNAIISVTSTKSCDRDELKRLTERFIKKAMSEVKKDGNINSCSNFRKE